VCVHMFVYWFVHVFLCHRVILVVALRAIINCAPLRACLSLHVVTTICSFLQKRIRTQTHIYNIIHTAMQHMTNSGLALSEFLTFLSIRHRYLNTRMSGFD